MEFDHPYRPKHKQITRKSRLNFSNKRRGQKRSPAFNSILVSNSSIVDEPQSSIDSSTAEHLWHPRVITSITDILPMPIIPIETAFTHRTTMNNMRCDDQSLYSPLHSYYNAFDESPFGAMIHRQFSIRVRSRVDSFIIVATMMIYSILRKIVAIVNPNHSYQDRMNSSLNHCLNLFNR